MLNDTEVAELVKAANLIIDIANASDSTNVKQIIDDAWTKLFDKISDARGPTWTMDNMHPPEY